jgi:hypothetical protein
MIKTVKLSLLALQVACLFTLSAGAAELNMMVNAAEKTVKVENLLAQPVYVVSVVSGENYLPMNAELASGGSATVPFSGTFPASVDYANAFPAGPDAQAGLAGFQPGPTGSYRLSVQIN